MARINNIPLGTTVIVCLMVNGLLEEAGAADACSAEKSPVTEFGVTEEQTVSVTPAAPIQPISFPEHKPVYYRLKITRSSDAQQDWQLVLRDQTFRPLQILRPGDFSGVTAGTATATVWTNRLASPKIFVDLVSNLENQSEPRLKVTEILVMPEKSKGTFYSWKNPAKEDYGELYGFEGKNDDDTRLVKRLGDYIGMLVSRGDNDEGKPANWCCSGVLLSPDLYLTNWHCGSAMKVSASNESAYWHATVLDATFVDTSWSKGDRTGEFCCATKVASNKELDFSLLRIKPFPGNTLTPASRKKLKIADPVPSDDLVIVHHPECKPKHVSVNCHMTAPSLPNWQSGAATDFGHDCDTEGGSSGAPVFTRDGTLVGLHHLGHEIKNGICDKQNKATRIGLILTDILNQRPELRSELQVIDGE
jgi:hypothetical protein